MAKRTTRTFAIATLLAVAALVCLGVGLRLMAASDEAVIPTSNDSEAHYTGVLAIIGGLVIFLLGAIALLAARRFAVSGPSLASAATNELNLVDVQQWGHDLELIRDDLRRDVAICNPQLQIQHQELELPAAWRPEGQYVLTSSGRPADPLAGLKHTRDQLLVAAERVDDIVQSINETTATHCQTDSFNKKRTFWHRFWIRRVF